MAAPRFVRYRVHQLIGVGATGPVYHGDDTQAHRDVAIKALRTELTPDINRWIAEELNNLIDRLPSHPAVAALRETGLENQEPYLVRDFAPGEPLDRALRRFGPGAIDEVLPRLRAIADGLDQAAAQGIRHGALHPPDVIVSHDSTVVTGVGVAEILAEAGMTVPSRAPYVAPELMAGEFPSSASDQFSLAAIAFEWLFGEPIPGPATVGMSVPDLPGVNHEALRHVFTTALARTPSERFDSCHAFVDGLSACVPETVEAAVSTVAAPITDSPIEAQELEEVFAGLTGPSGRQQPERVVVAPAARVSLISRFRESLPRMQPVAALRRFGLALAALRPLEPLNRFRRALAAMRPLDGARRFGITLAAALPAKRSTRIALATAATLVIGTAWGVRSGVVTMRRLRTLTEPVAAAPVLVDRVADTEPTGSASPSPSIVSAHAVIPSQTAKTATDLPVSASLPAKRLAVKDAKRQEGKPLSSPARDARPGSRAPTNAARRQAPAPAATRSATPVAARAPAPVATRLPAPPRQAPVEVGNGSLFIESRPSGAAIAVNGMARGRTPLSIGAIPAGDYQVTLTLPKFEPLSLTVHVTAGERARVGPSLTPQDRE